MTRVPARVRRRLEPGVQFVLMVSGHESPDTGDRGRTYWFPVAGERDDARAAGSFYASSHAGAHVEVVSVLTGEIVGTYDSVLR